MTPSVREFREVALAGLAAAMPVVRAAQRGSRRITPDEIKGDHTIVTVTDRESQEAAFRAMDRALPGLLLIGEEKGDYAGLNVRPDQGQDGWLVDPLDGTSALAQGLPTSTVIIAYRENGCVIGCAIGEPISDRFWWSCGPSACTVALLGEEGDEQECKVWSGPCDKQATVYVDVSHGFNKGKTTDDSMAKLHGLLNHHTKVIMPGSNGLMQAMVANGGHGVVGSISSAKGGPWDLAGGLLVQQAGGVTQGLYLNEGACKLCHGRKINHADVLICANDPETLKFLVGSFLDSM